MAQALASFSSTPFPYVDPLILGDDIISRGAILKSGVGAKVRGTILSYDLATSKVIAPAAAVNCNCILAEDCDSTAADASCIIYVGGQFTASGVVWPAAMAHDAVTEALRDAGIQLESVEVSGGNMVKPAALETERTRADDTAIVKDPNAPEIITATGPVPRETEGEAPPKDTSMDPHPVPLRVQPGQTEPPKEENEKHAGGGTKPTATTPTRPPHHEPPNKK